MKFWARLLGRCLWCRKPLGWSENIERLFVGYCHDRCLEDIYQKAREACRKIREHGQ